ncbi:TetR/AcrR family transcriptional regulator [Mycolicibacterium tokaiense]|uniref:TetR family transcriptional regulator n=1 Tax=Mycolicibacterium tokaiense TaxID=39695 RepID=A0A378T8I3_9MYCO|nr:TetR/AcrR family transcriptional regulator [Mycolicibacterium tokaiense]BBY88343.1 TetR family transcriptional regulator [Mycolicibacterium tokaiense]STZ57132.1 TetR family transcriptional regulator [Mycolicibacterium tokaiense]
MARSTYHHGDLRAALIDAGLEMVAANGIAALSVADAAKRAGVSAAAPYRHFPNRKAFLAAVTTAAAQEFGAEVQAAVDKVAGDDPLDLMEATAQAYVRFVIRRRIGWDVIFGNDLRDLPDADLAVTRSLSDAFLAPALEVTAGDVPAALRLVEHEIAACHGYASLYLAGMFDPKYPEVDRAATQAGLITRALAEAARFR